MSVIFFDRVAETRGRVERPGSGLKRVRTYTQNWVVHSDSAEDTEPAILSVDGMPRIADEHPYDPGAFVKAKEANRRSEALLDEDGETKVWVWDVVVEYSSDASSTTSPIYPETPAKISYGFDRLMLPVTKDRDDKAVVNTASDPFSPPLMVEFPIPVKTIVVNLADGDFAPSMLLDYFMAISNDTVEGFAAKCTQVQDIQASSEVWTDEDGVDHPYWQVTIKLAFNAFGWQPELLSQGYREINGDGDKKPILIDGQPTQSPLPLDEDGAALTGTDVTAAKFIKFKIYNEVALAALNY